jgi:hypothetical protein
MSCCVLRPSASPHPSLHSLPMMIKDVAPVTRSINISALGKDSASSTIQNPDIDGKVSPRSVTVTKTATAFSKSLSPSFRMRPSMPSTKSDGRHVTFSFLPEQSMASSPEDIRLASDSDQTVPSSFHMFPYDDDPLVSCSYGTLHKLYEASTAQMLARIQKSRGLLSSPSTTPLAPMHWSSLMQERGVTPEKAINDEDYNDSSESVDNNAYDEDDLDAIFDLEL